MKDRVRVELIARIRKNHGDREAWEELLGWLIPRLTGVLRQRLIPADVEEVIQETYLRMREKWHTFRGTDLKDFESWARKIAQNCRANLFRGGLRGRTIPLDHQTLEIPAPGPDPMNQAAARLALSHAESFVTDYPSGTELAGQFLGDGKASNGAQEPATGTQRSRKSVFLSALRKFLKNLGVTWGDDE